MTAFIARWASQCAACDMAISPGDQALFVDDQVVHASCEGPALRRSTAETCTECWLERPCPCDDGNRAA